MAVKKDFLFQAAVCVTALTILSRCLGMLREAIVAAYFGANAQTDAFFVAFRVPDMLFNSLLNFLVTTAFLPIFSEALISGNAAARALAGSVMNWIVLVLSGIAGLMALFAPQLAGLIAPGFSPETTASTVHMIRIMAPVVVFGGLTGLGKSILNAFGHIMMPALVPVVYNVAIIGFVLLLGRRYGVVSMAFGMVAAAVLQAALLGPLAWKHGMRAHLGLDRERARLKRVGALIAPAAAGLLIGQLMPFVEVYLASSLGAGAVSYLGYAYRLFTVPEQIFTVVVSTVIFPMLAYQAARRDLAAMAKTISSGIRLAIFVILPLSFFLIAFSSPVVKLMLARGAFGNVAAGDTSRVFAAYCLCLLPVCIRSLVTFALFALQQSALLMRWTAYLLPLNVALDIVLMRHFSFVGIAIGSSVSALVHTAALGLLLRKRLGNAPVRLLPVTGKAAVGGAVMLLIVVPFSAILESWCPGVSAWRQAAILTLLLAAASLSYFIVALGLKAEEARMVLCRLRSAVGFLPA